MRLHQGGSLSVQEAEDLVAEKEVDEQINEEIRCVSRTKKGELHARHCGICGNTGHNARTCQLVIETSEENDSE